jgi:hypothetical protein
VLSSWQYIGWFHQHAAPVNIETLYPTHIEEQYIRYECKPLGMGMIYEYSDNSTCS